VLFFLSAGWGPAVRTLPIMRELARHGIACSFAMGETISPVINAAGFDVVELSLPAVEVMADKVRNWWSPYHYVAFQQNDVGPLLHRVEAYRKAILDLAPDVVVTDLNPAGALAARSLQICHVTISQSVFLRDEKSEASRWAIPPALPAVNRVLAHYGVRPLESVTHLELGEATVLPSFPEFDPLPNVPPALEYTGPILGNALIPLGPSSPSSAARNGVPLIFLYPGRPHDGAGPSGQLLLNVGLAALRAVNATVTVATGGSAFEIPEYPTDRVHVVAWRVISAEYKPDLIIHHGGHGACLTAISAGSPSLGIPTHAEREYNANHLAALGCGEFVPIQEIDVPRVRRAIETVLDDATYAHRCTQWSKTIAARRYGGADRAARMIMEMI
jgi:UDP:flavonoid glycosyltransferase YjiC (YdhE family)